MVTDQLKGIVGNWVGSSTLFTPWLDEKEHVSEAAAIVTTRAGDTFLDIAYTWSHEGKEHEGLLVIGSDKEGKHLKAVFSDSWHMANDLMLCEGDADGRISVYGTYKVEGYPEWGWRTELILEGDAFQYLMFNVSPDDGEEIAVRMELMRAGH